MRLFKTTMLAAMVFASPAYAAIYDFSVRSTVQSNGDASYVPNFQFSIDTNGNHYSNPYSVTFLGIETSGQRPALGSPGGDVEYSTNYNFYPSNSQDPIYGGGFDDDGAGHSYYSDVLFAGTTGDPRFLVGSHNLFYDPGTASVDAVLTIAKEASAVPEVSTWAMMILGFGVIGFSLRRARKSDERFTDKVRTLALS